MSLLRNDLSYAHKLYIGQSERSDPTFLPYLVVDCSIFAKFGHYAPFMLELRRGKLRLMRGHLGK